MRIIILLVFVLSACNQNKKMTENKVTTVQKTEEKIQYKNNCYDDRSVNSALTNFEGKIVIVLDTYMVASDNKRYAPCELPVEFQKEGMEVSLSGEIMEIKPNERLAGSPIKVTSITAR